MLYSKNIVFSINSLNLSLSHCDLTFLILSLSKCKMEIMQFHNVRIKQDNICILDFWGCRNKVPQSGWLKQQKFNSITVLETRNRMSSFFFFWGLVRICSIPLLMPQQFLVGRRRFPCVFIIFPLCMYVCFQIFL